MSLEDQFKLLVGCYFGVRQLDEYDLKEYILKDIEEYIKDFISANPIDSFDYRKEAFLLEDELSEKTKMQDALIVLHKMKAPIEVVLLVRKRIKMLEDIEKAK